MNDHKADQVHDYDLQFNYPREHGNLLRSMLDYDWDGVMRIIQSDSFINEIQQNTLPILHIACSISMVPVAVIDMIIRIYGNSCCKRHDEDGNLPIHVACSTPGISSKIIRNLLLTSPSTSK